MGYKVMITGTTGMVGKGVLLECMDHPAIEAVLLINRSPARINHPKITEVLVKDFFDLSPIKEKFIGYDACFFCLGITSMRQTEEKYAKITHDLTLYFAKTFQEQNDNAVFCYVSGAGTDSSEKGSTMWARVKGKTENDLLSMPFKGAYMFRPGYIQPLRGIKSKTQWYQALYTAFSPVYLILKHFPGTATNTTNIGLAMINTLESKSSKAILETKDINQLSML